MAEAQQNHWMWFSGKQGEKLDRRFQEVDSLKALWGHILVQPCHFDLNCEYMSEEDVVCQGLSTSNDYIYNSNCYQ